MYSQEARVVLPCHKNHKGDTLTSIPDKEFKQLALSKGIMVHALKESIQDALKTWKGEIVWMVTEEEIDKIVIEIRLIDMK